MFTMQYECPCGTAWQMTHLHHCDDRCPACDLVNSPTDVQDHGFYVTEAEAEE